MIVTSRVVMDDESQVDVSLDHHVAFIKPGLQIKEIFGSFEVAGHSAKAWRALAAAANQLADHLDAEGPRVCETCGTPTNLSLRGATYLIRFCLAHESDALAQARALDAEIRAGVIAAVDGAA